MKIEFFKLVDKVVGIPLCIVLGVFSKLIPLKERNIEKILIIKLWALGDSIVSLPMIKGLKKRYPKANITILCRKINSPAYKQKFIDHLLFFDGFGVNSLLFHFKKYDVIIDIEPYLNMSALLSWYLGKKRIGFGGQIRSMLYHDKNKWNRSKHVLQQYLDLAKFVGVKGEEKLVGIWYSHADQIKVSRFLKKNKITRKRPIVGIGIGVGPTGKIRLWPSDRWAKVCDSLSKEKNAQIVFIGMDADNELIKDVQQKMKSRSVNTAGRFSVPQSAYLLSLCDLMIAPDTGTMHMAAAMGTRTLGLFGPNLPSLWSPFGEKNDYIFHKTPGAPLIRNEKGFVPEIDPYNSMGKIAVQEVLQKARKML